MKPISWLLAAVLAQATLANTIPWHGSPYFLTTRGMKVADLLQDLGAHYGIPVVVSDQVNDTFVGSLSDKSPEQMLSDLAQQFHLAPYYDGKTLYVYKTQQMTSQVITPVYLAQNTLQSYLEQGHLGDPNYCSLRSIAGLNAFEVFGVPVCVDRVSQLAKSLDSAALNQAQNKETVDVFPLKYANATDTTYTYRNQPVVVPGIVTMLQQMSQGHSLPPTTVAGQAASTPSTMTPSNNGLPMFAADSRENAVIVRDRQANMGMYQKLIQALDKKPEQIQITVTIIDVDAGDLSALGIDWSANMNLGPGSISFNQGGQSADGSTSSGTLVTDSGSFAIRLNALEQHAKARILSRPSVVTLNNVQAVLDRNVTFYTKVSGEKVANLQSVTAGSLLRVTPRLITDEGKQAVMLSLDIQDGRQAPAISEQESLPQVQNAEITTQATLKPGQSLLLGGFVQDELTEGQRKIPWLGDLPLIGGLFRSSNKQKHSVVRLFQITAVPMSLE